MLYLNLVQLILFYFEGQQDYQSYYSLKQVQLIDLNFQKNQYILYYYDLFHILNTKMGDFQIRNSLYELDWFDKVIIEVYFTYTIKSLFKLLRLGLS